jgi:hypothetical protein
MIYYLIDCAVQAHKQQKIQLFNFRRRAGMQWIILPRCFA